MTYLYSLATDYFIRPYNLCIKSDGTLYVVDQGSFLKKFNNKDIIDLSFKLSNELVEKLKNNKFSAITTNDDYLYITIKDRELLIIDNEGKIVKSLFYEDQSWFCSITYDKNTDSVILADNSQLIRLYKEGTLKEKNIHAELWQPSGVCINSTGDIIIADTNNQMIKIFDTNLELKTYIVGPDSEYDLSPFGITTDANNRIYVSNLNNPEIWIFNPEGKLIYKYTADPNNPLDFVSPRGIAIYDNYLYVTDTFNNRVQKFIINYDLLNQLEEELKNTESDT